MRCIGLLPERWTKDLEDELVSKLVQSPDPNLGEVGLDRRFEQNISLMGQEDALRRMLRTAIENGRSISLHCVRATGHMTRILSEFSFRPFSILWHGFSGSPETAAQLYRMGVITSIGPRFSGDVRLLFDSNPMTVLETDYVGTSEKEHQRILQDLYDSVSTALSKDMEKHCLEVFRTFSDAT